MKAAAPVVTIDGPSASGKGTVAQQVAQALGFHYLDSGALYRLTALAAMQDGVALTDEDGLTQRADALDVTFGGGGIRMAGLDVTDALRTEEVSDAASRVAAVPRVRGALLERQRRFRQPPGLVADGRDMGSVVFPDAQLKVYLTAGVETRAERRYKQLMEKGIAANIHTLLRDLRERDARDAGRAVAPLRANSDAQLLDTTGLGVEEAVARIVCWARERCMT